METNNFTQLCVWYGCVVLEDGPMNSDKIADFESFMQDHFESRVKYHTEIKTLPDMDENGNTVPDSGGRNDLFFYVHSEDVSKFAVPRLKAGIRWWEDVVGYNDNSYLYPSEFIQANPLTW